MRIISSFFLIFVIAVSLVACGGTSTDNQNTNANTVTPGNIAEEVPAPDNTKDDPPVEKDPVVQVPDANEKLAATIEIELEVEGNVEKRTGTLAISDNGYYLYTLPQFKFTPEEPNADQVYMDKFEDYYMRILTLGTEPDLVDVRKNAEDELTMLGDVVEMTGEQIGESALRDSVFYLHSSDSTLSKYIILREIDGNYFKVIVNMPNSEASEGAGPSFPAMIKTIQPTKP